MIGAADTPFGVPHNVALTPNGKKIYVTHSGATANKASVYTVRKKGEVPIPSANVTVGVNPFGIAAVPYRQRTESRVGGAGRSRQDTPKDDNENYERP